MTTATPDSTVKTVPALLHALGLSTMAWAFIDLHHVDKLDWIANQTGGHFQFLTIQGLALACLTFFLAVASDVLPTLRFLATLRRSILLIAMPLSVTISSIYWSLLLLFPTLILAPLPATSTPSASTSAPVLFRIPLSLDLGLHAAPALFLLFHFYLLEYRFPPDFISRLSLLLSLVFAVWYSAWVEYCAYCNGTFPYPFLHVPFPHRIAIYCTTTTFANICLRLLNAIHY